MFIKSQFYLIKNINLEIKINSLKENFFMLSNIW
jgi:hypothetical protein